MSKLSFALTVVGVAATSEGFNENMTCGDCIDGNFIYCYKGKTPQTAMNQDFNSYSDFSSKCCANQQSCPEYLNKDLGYFCLYNYHSTGSGASLMPKSGCPYVTSACGSYRDLTEQQETTGNVALEAKNVPKGEVCAFKLDPTKTKPVISLLGDDEATVEVIEVQQEVPDKADDELKAALAGGVNFLKNGDAGKWDSFFEDEQNAFQALDEKYVGFSVDTEGNKRFRSIINLKHVPIDKCLASKIQSEHTFNYNTEKDRMPYDNPDYNAALTAWNQKYDSRNKEGGLLSRYEGAPYIENPVSDYESTPGPAVVKKTFQAATLKKGENESAGGSSGDDSDAGTPLQCEDEDGGCRVYLVFNPQVDGIELSMNVKSTIDPSTYQSSYALGKTVSAVVLLAGSLFTILN